MQLIGKKIERSKEISLIGKSELAVNVVNGHLALTHTAVRKTGLGSSRGKTIGVAYDTDNAKTYLYIDTKGLAIAATGVMTSRFHAKELAKFHGISALKFKMTVSTTVHNDNEYPGVDFFEVSPIKVGVSSAVEEVPAMEQTDLR